MTISFVCLWLEWQLHRSDYLDFDVRKQVLLDKEVMFALNIYRGEMQYQTVCYN